MSEPSDSMIHAYKTILQNIGVFQDDRYFDSSGARETLCCRRHTVLGDPCGCVDVYKGNTQAYVAASY